jgi:hypothetical protein
MSTVQSHSMPGQEEAETGGCMFEIYNLGTLPFHYCIFPISLCVICMHRGRTEVDVDQETMLVTMKTPEQGRTGSSSAAPKGILTLLMALHSLQEEKSLRSSMSALQHHRLPRAENRCYTAWTTAGTARVATDLHLTRLLRCCSLLKRFSSKLW